MRSFSLCQVAIVVRVLPTSAVQKMQGSLPSRLSLDIPSGPDASGLSLEVWLVRSVACQEEGNVCLMSKGWSGLSHVKRMVRSVSFQLEGCTDIHVAIVVVMPKVFFLLV